MDALVSTAAPITTSATSSTFGSAMVGHSDRRGLSDNLYARSWNASHMSRSCTPDDLRATGGNGKTVASAKG